MSDVKRPGSGMAQRPLHFFWLVDCSSSMSGAKIGAVNNAIKSALPAMVSVAEEHPGAQLLVRAMKFSTGASWITSAPVPVEDYVWEDMEADGLTDLGAAFSLLSEQLEMPPMPERALPPVIVVLSDGQPVDDYKRPLEKLKSMPWGKKAVKVAIAIGQDADKAVLGEFTGNCELVLEAGTPETVARLIKWASTEVVRNASQPTPAPIDPPESAPATEPLIDSDFDSADADDVVF